ncbi:MAG TPA: TlpA disulfide reductase family protein [Balneolales bacterium]|nr:TlpA disulfide reductase family protein [Balneolales bacterium]
MRIFVFIGIVFIFQACGTKQEGAQSPKQKTAYSQATSSLQRLDPHSSPLFAAHEKVPAKDFNINLLNGQSFRLSDQKGKVMLLNIWATWCPPCREETPELEALYKKYKNKGLIILGVSVDKQGESVVRPFIKKYHVTYPIYIDKSGKVMSKYGPTMGIPTTYIIDKRGDLRYFTVGALTKKELEPRIKKLLNETG